MIDRLFTLGLLAAGALLPCMERLRATDPRRRTLLLAAASLAGLAAFQPLRGAPTDLGAAPLAAPSSLLAAAGSAIALFAVGMAWNAILADSRRRSARWATLGLGAASLALGLCASGPGVWVALPLALRTGWARGLDRRWPTIVAVLAGLAALIAWPALPERGACWPPGCDWGLALARFARLFLGLQLALLAVRLAFGVVFGPRRIGRRLLASHLVIGVLPVVLTGFFVTVTALLAIASLRASLAGRILVLHHELTQELAASRLAAVAARAGERASGWHEDPEELTDLARRLAEDWGPAASWRSPAPPADPPDPLQGSRLMIALSAFPATGHSPADDGAAARPAGAFPGTGTPPSSPEGGAPAPPGPGRAAFAPPPASILGASVLVELTRDPRLPPTLLGRIHSVAGDSLRASGDAARLASLPPPQAWALRPAPGGGAGLIKAHGLTLHAADALAEAGGVLLRAQVIEELPRGRTRPLETLLAEGARIEERMHWSLSLDPGARRTQVTLATDTLAAFGPAGSRVSSYKVSYGMVAAQEWTADRSWQEIHLAVLGLSAIRDLILPMPRVSENPLALLPVVILFSAALLFVLVETAALYSVVRTGRAIGESVSALRGGAERLQQGELAYRLPIRGSDELADLGASFNDMARGLEQGRAHALERERLEGELALARRIQERLLPAEPPPMPGCRLAGMSLPARHVGGDYYDFIRLPGERLLFVLADVSGKGAPAALLMSSVRAALHNLPTGRERPAEIVARLNAFILSSTSESEFVTLFLGLLDGCDGKLTYVNAGHEQPYILRAGGGLEQLQGGGLILGVFAQAAYTDAAAHLAPGDTLFLYTDGLSDAVNPEGEMFEEERVRGVLQGSTGIPAPRLLEAVLAAVTTFADGAEAADDITLVAVEREAEAPVSRSRA